MAHEAFAVLVDFALSLWPKSNLKIVYISFTLNPVMSHPLQIKFRCDQFISNVTYIHLLQRIECVAHHIDEQAKNEKFMNIQTTSCSLVIAPNKFAPAANVHYQNNRKTPNAFHSSKWPSTKYLSIVFFFFLLFCISLRFAYYSKWKFSELSNYWY